MNIPPNWTESDINLNGDLLHYYRVGPAAPGSKPTLVLAHGFTDTGLCWQPTAEDLAADYDIVMPDARAHGRSARVQPGGSYDLVDDLATIIRGLNLSRPIVFGHSMGAMEASELAARHADLVSALVLIDPPWRLPELNMMGAFRISSDGPMAPFVRSLADKTLQQLIDECRSEHPSWPEVIVQSWCEGKKLLDQHIVDTTMMRPGVAAESISRITCPTLLITADPELGGIVTPEVAALAQRLNPRIKVARIDGAGHHIPFSSHAPYMQAVRAFLNSL